MSDLAKIWFRKCSEDFMDDTDCGKCEGTLSPHRSFPRCSKCTKTYHFKCLDSIHQSKWRGWTLSERSTWVCDYCKLSVPEQTEATKKRALSSPEALQSGPVKKLFSEEAAMLTKEDITTLIKNTVTSSVSQAVANAFAPIDEKIKKMFEDSNKALNELRKENEKLQNRICELEKKVEDSEQYSKNYNAVISGVPVRHDEDPVKIVKKIAASCEIQIQDWEIIAAHRLKSRQNGDTPIIVKFHRKVTKENMIMNVRKKKLTAELFGGKRDSKLFVNEHLTTNKSLLFKKARELKDVKFGYQFVWVKNGQIMARKQEGDRVEFIKNERDLNDIIGRNK